MVFSRWQLCCSSAELFGQLLPQQGGTIQFWMLPSVPEIISRIYILPCFGRLVCRSAPALSLYAIPNICWVLVAPLGSCLVGLYLFSAFALWITTESSALRAQFLAPPLTVQQWEISSLPHACSPGWVRRSTPNSDISVRLQFVVCFSVLLGGGVLSAQGLHWIIFPERSGVGGVRGGEGEPCVVCDAHLFLL
jgi:hypothetical protein